MLMDFFSGKMKAVFKTDDELNELRHTTRVMLT